VSKNTRTLTRIRFRTGPIGELDPQPGSFHVSRRTTARILKNDFYIALDIEAQLAKAQVDSLLVRMEKSEDRNLRSRKADCCANYSGCIRLARFKTKVGKAQLSLQSDSPYLHSRPIEHV